MISYSSATDLWRVGRNAVVVGTVTLLHTGALWSLQNSMTQQQPPELIVPAQIVAELVTPATSTPGSEPMPPVPVAQESDPAPRPPSPVSEPTPSPAPEPQARPQAKPRTKPQTKPRSRPTRQAPPKPASYSTSATTNPAAAQGSAAPSTAAIAGPNPTPVTLPSSTAAYLNNPPPVYPRLSLRMRESGCVVVRVLIETNGRARKGFVQQSSGYQRLDQVALETARDHWRYKPGTRGGRPEAMWFDVPINFVLE